MPIPTPPYLVLSFYFNWVSKIKLKYQKKQEKLNWVELIMSQSEQKREIGHGRHRERRLRLYLGRRSGNRKAKIRSNGESVGHASDASQRLLPNPSAVTPHRHSHTPKHALPAQLLWPSNHHFLLAFRDGNALKKFKPLQGELGPAEWTEL